MFSGSKSLSHVGVGEQRVRREHTCRCVGQMLPQALAKECGFQTLCRGSRSGRWVCPGSCTQRNSGRGLTSGLKWEREKLHAEIAMWHRYTSEAVGGAPTITGDSGEDHLLVWTKVSLENGGSGLLGGVPARLHTRTRARSITHVTCMSGHVRQTCLSE